MDHLEHSWGLGFRLVVFLLPPSFLHSTHRFERMHKRRHLRRVHVLAERLQDMHDPNFPGKKASQSQTHAWFVFEPTTATRQQRLDPLPFRLARPINLLRHSSSSPKGHVTGADQVAALRRAVLQIFNSLIWLKRRGRKRGEDRLLEYAPRARWTVTQASAVIHKERAAANATAGLRQPSPCRLHCFAHSAAVIHCLPDENLRWRRR